MTTPTVTSSNDALEQALGKLLKPGAKTTEFLGLIAVYAGGLAALLGAFSVHNQTINGAIKIAALVAVAVSHVGYALSRGDTKAALGAVTSTLVAKGVLVPTVVTPVAAPADGGFTNNFVIGLVLLVAGIVLCVISGGSLLLLIIGIVVAVVGFALAFAGYSGRGSRLP